MFCANCGREIEPGRKFCRFCGAPVGTPASSETPEAAPRVAPVVTPVAPPAPPGDLEPWELSQPTQPLEWDEVTQETRRHPEPPPKRPAMWAFVAGLILVICVGAALAAYFLLRDDSGTSTDSTDTAVASTAGSGTTDPDGGPAGSTTSEGADGEGTSTSNGPGQPVDLSPAALSASSTLAPQGSTDYGKANLLDDDPTTCWAEGVTGYGVGESVEFTFADPVTVTEIRIVPGYDKIADGWDRWSSNGRVRTFDLDFSDGTSESYSVTDSRELQAITFSAPHTVATVRFTITGVYEAADGPNKAEDTSISELHLWGVE